MAAARSLFARLPLSPANVLWLAATFAMVSTDGVDIPTFGEPIHNITVPVGREAVLTCVVEGLYTYKVAWLKVDTQTILTIASHVITKNHRIHVTHSDRRTWYLHLKDVKESDQGWYMCQVNTDPMKSQSGYLEVVVPPDILDYPTSTDMVVREGSNVTMRCAATGSPEPNITWRREGGELIPLGNGDDVSSVEGPVFNITRVNRLHMGAYLCIASNGVPPTISKRILLIVHFPPMISVQNQLVGADEGQEMTLECLSEAYPKSINYWTRDKGNIIAQGGRYEPVLLDNAYKVHMKLTIKAVSLSDFGSYKCVSKNSLGETDGTIKLEHVPRPTTSYAPSTTTETPVKVVEKEKIKKQREKDKSRAKAKDKKPAAIEVAKENTSAESSKGTGKLSNTRALDNRLIPTGAAASSSASSTRSPASLQSSWTLLAFTLSTFMAAKLYSSTVFGPTGSSLQSLLIVTCSSRAFLVITCSLWCLIDSHTH